MLLFGLLIDSIEGYMGQSFIEQTRVLILGRGHRQRNQEVSELISAWI
jgi:hypothetical protein